MDQATVLRRLTGAERLMQALHLSDFVRELAIKGKQSLQGRQKRKRP